jgi:Protein of unknown function (DUF3105)
VRSPILYPADGKKPDPAQPLPQNPPKGIQVYLTTTNRTVEGPIEYDRKPPTNGDHAPLWQNCGFYDEPIQDRYAVHSMDHGVVWITYRPDLPQQQLQTLRSYGNENYVIVSPYPGQTAPVIATSWRVQLKLRSANDPRLERFVNQFKISGLSPLSGNRCILGVGNPKGRPGSPPPLQSPNPRFPRGSGFQNRPKIGLNPECQRRPPLSPRRNVPG